MNLLEAETRQAYRRTPYETCPLCRSDQFDADRSAPCNKHPLWRPGLPWTIEWNRCRACGHSFVDGYFDGDALEFLLGAAQPSQTPGHEVERGRMVAADMVDRIISAACVRKGRWLDVGFGAGHLLTTAQEYGFDVVGIDLRESACKPLQAFGYDVRPAALSSLRGSQPFDVISMADVLEHTSFPRDELAHARQLLTPTGALFVSMPNADSFAWRALDIAGANPYWSELEHYHNFGRESLYRLLRETGFEPVSYSVSRRYRACMEVIAQAAN